MLGGVPTSSETLLARRSLARPSLPAAGATCVDRRSLAWFSLLADRCPSDTEHRLDCSRVTQSAGREGCPMGAEYRAG